MDIEELKMITVVGAGVMGSGIAQVGLMNGYTVHLCDNSESSLSHAVENINTSLDKLLSKNIVTPELVSSIKNGKLVVNHSIEEAVRQADLIIEAVPEDMSIKRAVFKKIEENAGEDVVVASNTSTMSITSIALSTSIPGKILGMHFFNPPVLMRLVEVISSEYTTEETLKFGCDYVNKIGKTLIVARKDTPGFIANRIAAPVVVYNGLCIDVEGIEPSDIDLSMMKIGQKMGPMELADFSGVDVMNDVQRYYHEYLSSDYNPSRIAQQLQDANKLGKKSGLGYYEWKDGKRPVLDSRKYSGRYNAEIPFIIQANEASKLIEQGVCTAEDCDKAMLYGYNTQGPIEYIQKFDPDYLSAVLQDLAGKYKKAIFRPTGYIQRGKYLHSKDVVVG